MAINLPSHLLAQKYAEFRIATDLILDYRYLTAGNLTQHIITKNDMVI